MTRSIKWRMVSIFVLLVVIVMMASGTLIVYQTRNYEYNLIKEELADTADVIQSAVITEDSIDEIESNIKNVISGIGVSLKDKKVYILDDNGTIIFSQSVVTKEKGFYGAQVMAALLNESIDEYDEVSLSGDENAYLGYARGIVKDSETVFVVYILSSTVSVEEKIRFFVMIIVISVLFAIVLSVILAFLFSSFLTKPISALTAKAREMAKGKLDNPIDVFSNDEIGELTTNFNRMAISLNETLAQIASEKNKMETVITHMTDGILVFDNFGQIIHKNPAAVQMIGVEEIEEFNDVFEDTIEEDFSAILLGVEKAPKKVMLIVHDMYYSVDFARYLDKDGVSKGLICVIQDITEHKKLEKMQKEFVANVSHELRTPLTTIKSYAETLLDGAVEDLEIATQFLSVINNESDRMTSLVQDLLELSRLDSKKASFERNLVNLTTLLFNSVENYRIHAKKKLQELVMQGVNGEHMIYADSNRVEQVIKNLLSNAVKYSEEGAHIEVTLYMEEAFHVVSVKDTGMGIPEEDLDHVFERFYRVDKARSRAMGGTGLGLAIAKEIMELHGGKITVESEFNVGTTFKLYFPIIVM